jgi:hypothetical protein
MVYEYTKENVMKNFHKAEGWQCEWCGVLVEEEQKLRDHLEWDCDDFDEDENYDDDET